MSSFKRKATVLAVPSGGTSSLCSVSRVCSGGEWTIFSNIILAAGVTGAAIMTMWNSCKWCTLDT